MTKRKREALRVLVVEDEPGIVELCQTVLEGDGHEVDVALNGEDALLMIERDDEYDLCLLDIRTPVMTGPELYQCVLLEHLRLANRVVFTSGDTTGGDTKEFLERAGRPFLPKPFTPNELMTVIREALEG